MTVFVNTNKPVISVNNAILCNEGTAELNANGTESGDLISWYLVGQGAILEAVMPSLPDANITASSQYDANYAAHRARLNATYDPNWSAETNNTSQWIKVNCSEVIQIGAIATQGRYGYDQWVTSYKISYSNDDINWNYIGGTDLASATTFTGNSDRNTVVTNEFATTITAQYIRIHPVTWYSHISMRIEVYKSNILSSNSSLTVSTPGQYYVEVNRGNCFSRDTSDVIAITYPAGNDVTICEGGGSALLGINSITSATYSWSPGSQLNVTNIAQPTVTPYQNQTYTVTVTHPLGNCIDEVNVFAPVSVNAGDDLEICSGNEIIITPSYSGTVDSWQWTSGASMLRIPLNITNTGSVLNDYQISFTINTTGLISTSKMSSDCGDLRIYDSDANTPLNYWLEDGTCNTSSTVVWVKVPSLPNGTKTIYVYYNNPALTSLSNGDNVFEFFDDFTGSSINSSKWTAGTIGGVSGNEFSLSSGKLIGGNTNRTLSSNISFTGNYIAETRIYESGVAANGFTSLGFFESTSNGLSILSHNGTTFIRNDNSWAPSSSFTSINNWVRDKLVVIGNDSQFLRYNEGTTNTYSGTVNNSGLNNEYIRLGARNDDWSSNQVYTAQWDWIFVRKYANPEPTLMLGTEEYGTIIATTQSLTVNQPGVYIVTASGNTCSDTDSVVVSEATENVNKLAWRTKSSGNWSNTSIWEVFFNGTWIDASSYQDVCNNPVNYPIYKDSTITVRTNHTVLFNIPEPVDQLSVQTGALLNIPAGEHLQVVDSSSSSVTADIYNSGIIDIQEGSVLTAIGDATIENYGQINIAGSFNVGGGSPAVAKLVNYNNSIVRYYLNGDQTMWNGVYEILESAGSGLKTVGGANTRINTRVDFMGSKIQLNNRNIRLAQNATITGYSYSNGYFITNSTGTLIKESLGVSTGTFIIPIGHSSTSYNRLDIFNSGVADDFRFRVSGNIELTGSIMDELFQNSSVDRTWYITNDFGNSIYLNITFYWISSHENPEFQSNQCSIAQHDGISWKRYGIYGSASNSGVDYNDMHYYSANGITTTNPISVGSCYFEQLAYRSINNGNWSDLNNWEVYDENTSNWISPYFYNYSCGEITYPSSLSKSILIRHNITVDVNIPEGINSTIVESSGNIIIPTGKNLLVVEPKSGETSSLSNSGTINVYGTFSGVTGTIIQNNPNSLFEYFSNNQEIYSCCYANLKLNNGNKFNSANTTSIYENIIFNNSNLILNNYNFTLETNAQVVGASQSNGYFVAVDDGFLIVEFNLGENVSRTLHVGGNYYSPAILSFENITTPGTMLCRIRETSHPFDPSSIKRYWTINRGTLNFSANYRLSLKYLDSDLPYLPQNSEEELQLIRKGAIFSIDNSPNYWTYYTVGTSN